MPSGNRGSSDTGMRRLPKSRKQGGVRAAAFSKDAGARPFRSQSRCPRLGGSGNGPATVSMLERCVSSLTATGLYPKGKARTGIPRKRRTAIASSKHPARLRRAALGQRSGEAGRRGSDSAHVLQELRRFRPRRPTRSPYALAGARAEHAAETRSHDPPGSRTVVRRHGGWQQCRPPFAFRAARWPTTPPRMPRRRRRDQSLLADRKWLRRFVREEPNRDHRKSASSARA